ncbi:Hvo_1808 family surface protein [Halobaculum magnesiiphilum]|uniref:Hvo_1808 family surface protein n=1 Tax=Halobaculum magnesiiphilum TaxID=1017351 RepID=A0A8T8W912_9EURY|nr:Hvo_1808 family surface protein [Halobaculum magnesiiphilum]QZP36318.1 Hvo_1808 family surface protein [Halobaculum magnesiiphilum]
MRRSAPHPLSRLAALVFALALVCTAAAAPLAAAAPPAADAGTDRLANGSATAAQQEAPPDPDSDVIGWEGGYWHNESIDVDQSDGLSDEELDAYVSRAMARVEYLRDAEFDGDVPVSVISREEYRNRSAGGPNANRTEYNRWNDQVWEGLFIVGESTGSGDAIGETAGSSVLGFYSPAQDQITIVTDSPDSPTINNATLIHELVHALQDQRYDLTNETYRASTQDGDLAVDGVVEGEANYIETNYAQRCGDEWECVDTPQASGGGGGGGNGPNLGILLTLLNPYSDGPVYVNEIVEEGGWDAFEERFRDPPVSSEQVIHRTDETPRPIEFDDEGTNGWSTFPRENPQLGQNGSDTVGEASIYAMFWYQAREYRADTINPNGLFQTSGPYDTYNYDAEPSSGWANDRLFPYRNGEGDDAEYGYVWLTEWDTEADAREFHDTYLRMLDAHDVRETDEGYYVVPDGPFEDAFLVRLDGERVTIVNGPTVDDVRDIRPSLEPADTDTAENGNGADATATPSDTDAGDGGDNAGDDSGDNAAAGDDTSRTTEVGGAGFGFGVAAVAVAFAGLLARRRR